MNGIDGTGFWTEGLHPDPQRQATDGQVRCTASDQIDGGWEVSSDWCSATGDVLLRDRLAAISLDDLLRAAASAGLRRPTTEPLNFAI